MKKHGYQGINIYSGNMTNTGSLNLSKSCPRFSTKTDSSADYPDIILHEEHHEEGTPGPVASFNWVKRSLENLPVPPSKWIIGLGTYGYD